MSEQQEADRAMSDRRAAWRRQQAEEREQEQERRRAEQAAQVEQQIAKGYNGVPRVRYPGQ